MVVPPLIDADVERRPQLGSLQAVRCARIWWASSTIALRPFSGSTPAWAGRPSTSDVNRPDPLPRGLEAPVGERRLEDERELALPGLVLDQVARAGLPISSSEVNRTTSGRGIAAPIAAIAAERGLDQDEAGLHVEDARAERLAASTRNGIVASVPTGQTVS